MTQNLKKTNVCYQCYYSIFAFRIWRINSDYSSSVTNAKRPPLPRQREKHFIFSKETFFILKREKIYFIKSINSMLAQTQFIC